MDIKNKPLRVYTIHAHFTGNATFNVIAYTHDEAVRRLEENWGELVVNDEGFNDLQVEKVLETGTTRCLD